VRTGIGQRQIMARPRHTGFSTGPNSGSKEQEGKREKEPNSQQVHGPHDTFPWRISAFMMVWGRQELLMGLPHTNETI
jgi:hypothetical protein